MPDVIQIADISKESYAILTSKLPEYVTFMINEQMDKLLFAVPVSVGKITDVLAMMEHVLYQYGDMEAPLDYEAAGCMSDAREKLLANFKVHSIHPEESLNRVMGDITAALKAISDAVLSALDQVEIPCVENVGAIYRYHSVKKGAVALQLLNYEQLMELAGL